MAKQDQKLVRVRIFCFRPPECDAGQRFGLQNPDQTVIAGHQEADGSLRFECELCVQRRADGTPNFLGSFTHGTPADRFLYLTFRDDQQIRWRMKVGLKSITWAQVEQAAQDGVLEISIERRGVAYAPPLDPGWQIKNPR